MVVFFRVNNEYMGLCHFREGEIRNAALTEEQENAVPGTALIGNDDGCVDLSRHGFKKGDLIELEFDEKRELLSARKPGEIKAFWHKDQTTPRPQTTLVTHAALHNYATRTPHDIIDVDFRLRIDVTSIFIGIQRTELARVDWDEAYRTGREVCLLARSNGWQNLSGRVMQVIPLRSGKIIIMQPSHDSLLRTWPNVWVWVPISGSGGVLNMAADQQHKYNALMQALRGTWISVGQAIDHGWLKR